MLRSAALIAALLATLVLAPPTSSAPVTIYRCTDANGRLTLRDTPCRRGEKQETREMARPKDPPYRPAAPVSRSAPASPGTPAEAPRYIVVTPPRPMYECITSDGERYISETGEGRGRWEPYWLPAYPVHGYPHDRYGGGFNARIRFQDGKVGGSVRIGDPHPHRPPHRPPPVVVAPVYPAGQWIRDTCYPLPQADVCDRLRDQRYELDRRWNIAQPSERAAIDRETRSIDARLNNDCGGR